MSRRFSIGFLAAFSLPLLAAGATAEIHRSDLYDLEVETVVEGLVHPWGMAFLPDGAMLVTERPGRLRLVVDGKLVRQPVAGVPTVAARGQGGLLDVAVDPDFGNNGLIYLSYAEAGPGGAGTAVARARLVRQGNSSHLEDLAVIFRQLPKLDGGRHFGSRLVFAPDRTLFVTLGERGRRERAQNLSMHMGKVVRIGRDGAIPPDNPFVGRAGVRPEIWSYGHRNPQGATLDPSTGRLWTVEHGAAGGDEINRPEAGRNYGWPIISYGRHYSGAKIGIGTEKAGMEQPLYYWDPSIAPSGLAFSSGKLFARWTGDLFVGALAGQMLVRLDFENGRIVGEERLFDGVFGRIRDVREGPNGALWLLSDSSDGALLRVTPAQ